jgi:hypothetical protein
MNRAIGINQSGRNGIFLRSFGHIFFKYSIIIVQSYGIAT